ncbi:MAG: CDP-alcohol phosphatidyltransferase family protein [Gemmatimonadota bacterium]
MTFNLPNLITAARVALTPVIAVLLFQQNSGLRLLAFLLFLGAAVSDLWDGHVARQRGQVTTFGKMVDPIADKLLLLASLIPLYVLTGGDSRLAGLPVFERIPLWAVLILLGREALITTLRLTAARRGAVVAARRLGKRKAVAQNIFLGSGILWVSLRTADLGSVDGGFWGAFRAFHGWFTAVFLILALALTVISMAAYLFAFGRIFARRAS